MVELSSLPTLPHPKLCPPRRPSRTIRVITSLPELVSRVIAGSVPMKGSLASRSQLVAGWGRRLLGRVLSGRAEESPRGSEDTAAKTPRGAHSATTLGWGAPGTGARWQVCMEVGIEELAAVERLLRQSHIHVWHPDLNHWQTVTERSRGVHESSRVWPLGHETPRRVPAVGDQQREASTLLFPRGSRGSHLKTLGAAAAAGLGMVILFSYATAEPPVEGAAPGECQTPAAAPSPSPTSASTGAVRTEVRTARPADSPIPVESLPLEDGSAAARVP